MSAWGGRHGASKGRHSAHAHENPQVLGDVAQASPHVVGTDGVVPSDADARGAGGVTALDAEQAAAKDVSSAGHVSVAKGFGAQIADNPGSSLTDAGSDAEDAPPQGALADDADSGVSMPHASSGTTSESPPAGGIGSYAPRGLSADAPLGAEALATPIPAIDDDFPLIGGSDERSAPSSLVADLDVFGTPEAVKPLRAVKRTSAIASADTGDIPVTAGYPSAGPGEAGSASPEQSASGMQVAPALDAEGTHAVGSHSAGAAAADILSAGNVDTAVSLGRHGAHAAPGGAKGALEGSAPMAASHAAPSGGQGAHTVPAADVSHAGIRSATPSASSAGAHSGDAVAVAAATPAVGTAIEGVKPVSHHRDRRDTPRRRHGVIIALVIVAIATVLAVVLPRFLGGTQVEAGLPVTIEVVEGESSVQIAEDLHAAGVISQTRSFRSALSKEGLDTAILPGTYEDFLTGMTNEEAVAILAAGPVDNTIKLTIPEGYTLVQTAAAVETSGCGVTADAFTQCACDLSAFTDDYDFLSEDSWGTLEGFLFPKTYRVPEGATADDVVRLMLDQYAVETSSIDFDLVEGYSQADVLILASIIEKEAPVEDQRADVASVLYNRLSQGMRLQLDSTVVYALGDSYSGEGVVTLDDIKVDSPYNTYVEDGLPAGPICSPGLSAIKAAISPASTDYIYFVNIDLEGNLAFSATYEEFLADKEAYEKLLAEQES